MACQSANAPDRELKTVTKLFASCDARAARMLAHVCGLIVTGKDMEGPDLAALPCVVFWEW